MLKVIGLRELKPGHFITQVVSKKSGSAVKAKGKITSKKAIITLAEKGVREVEVDLSKSTLESAPEEISPPPERNLEEKQQTAKPKKANHGEADNQSLSAASNIHSQATRVLKNSIKNLQKGSANDLSSVSKISHRLLENFMDNASAMTCMTMIKDQDQYLLEHSVNCSVLMAMFAEHMGHSFDEIEDAALGALLMDIGMASLPDELKDLSAKMTSADLAVVEGHVDEALEMLEANDDLPELSRTVIAQHQERTDGSGYPNGLAGDEISVFARMAAIIDHYDMMISDRRNQKSVAPAVALKKLLKIDGLDHELVKQFVARIGIYPVGSLVKLKSGKLAMVSKVNNDDILNPVVMSFYSIKGNHYNEIKRIDLSNSSDSVDAGVQPREFGINLPKFFKQVFVS